MNTINDIEIYAKNITLETITQWLSTHFSEVTLLKQGKVVHDLEVLHNHQITSVVVVERAVGKAWTSIWFKSTNTPWSDDQQCAQALNNFCQCRVRFNDAPWQQGDQPDQWQQVDEQGTVKTVDWVTSS